MGGKLTTDEAILVRRYLLSGIILPHMYSEIITAIGECACELVTRVYSASNCNVVPDIFVHLKAEQ